MTKGEVKPTPSVELAFKPRGEGKNDDDPEAHISRRLGSEAMFN